MVGGRRCIGPIAIAAALTVLAHCASAGDATLTSRAGCTTGERVVVAAVGDLLFHNALQRQALTRAGDYKQFWQSLTSVLRGADLTYGNLEGPAGASAVIGTHPHVL
jgi:Bacterial capsule synthesis protein PGA_cap